MGRAPCCDRASVKRGPWSPDEDAILKSYIEGHGTGGNWIALPQKAGLKRCGKSCRLRWLNYLRPDIRHGGFTEEEDNIICSLYFTIGSRWSVIASNLPGRTDNDVKNYWNTRLKKKLLAGRVHSNTSSSVRGNIPCNAKNHSPCSITGDAPASTTLPHLRLPDNRQQATDFFTPTPSHPGLAEVSDTTAHVSSSSQEPSIGSSLGSSPWVVEESYSGLSIDSLLDLDFGAMLDVLSNGFGFEQEISSEVVPSTNSW